MTGGRDKLLRIGDIPVGDGGYYFSGAATLVRGWGQCRVRNCRAPANKNQPMNVVLRHHMACRQSWFYLRNHSRRGEQ
jgi:hypothetical protein